MARTASTVTISGADPTTAATIVAARLAATRDLPGGETIVEIADGAESCPLAQALAACHLLADHGDAAAARAFANRAQAGVAGATRYEAAWVELAAAWARGGIKEALGFCELLSRDHPEDLLATRHGLDLAVLAGEPRVMTRLLKRTESARGDDPSWRAMQAFALVETGRVKPGIEAAEAAMASALAAGHAVPLAELALAQGLLALGAPLDAHATLSRSRDAPQQVSAPMLRRLGRLWTLLLGEMGLLDEACDCLEGVVLPHDAAGLLRTGDSLAILVWLDLHGAEVTDVWPGLLEMTTPRGDGPVPALTAVLWAYGAARLGRGVAPDYYILGQGRALAEAASGGVSESALAVHRAKDWRDFVMPLAQGAIHFALGQPDKATRVLEGCLAGIPRLGGEAAIRDVVSLIYLEASIAGGLRDRGLPRIEARARAKPGSWGEQDRLARMLAALGRDDAADEAEEKALEIRETAREALSETDL